MSRGAQVGAVARGLASDVNSLAGVAGSVVLVAGAGMAGVRWNAAASAAVIFGGLAVLLFWRCVQLERRVADLVKQLQDVQAASDKALDDYVRRLDEWGRAVADQLAEERRQEAARERCDDIARLKRLATDGAATLPTLSPSELIDWSQAVNSLLRRLDALRFFDPWPPLINRGAEGSADDATVAAWREACIAYLPTLAEAVERLDAG